MKWTTTSRCMNNHFSLYSLHVFTYVMSTLGIFHMCKCHIQLKKEAAKLAQEKKQLKKQNNNNNNPSTSDNNALAVIPLYM